MCNDQTTGNQLRLATVPFQAIPAEEPRSVVRGEPVRMDRAHVDDTRTRSARRTMAHVD